MGKVYASFVTPDDALRAAGALLDHGMRQEDLAIVRADVTEDEWTKRDAAAEIEKTAKRGISTTTGEDAGSGAAKGAGWGAVAGAAAGLASLFVPGFGLVLGGGALATALGGAVGAVVGGAAAGGVAGYLKDQGVAEEAVTFYQDELSGGGAMLEMTVPSGDVDEAEATEVLAKYNGRQVQTVR